MSEVSNNENHTCPWNMFRPSALRLRLEEMMSKVEA